MSLTEPPLDLTRRLLHGPGASGVCDTDDAWAASGAMALTGRPDGPPLGAPAGLVDGLTRLAGRLAALTAVVGRRVAVDGPALLGERAALAGLTRRATTSAGGATRLVRAGDGWLAVALPRADDIALLPAWLGTDPVDPDDPWPAVTAAITPRAVRDLVADGALLGLAVAGVGARADDGLARATPRPGACGPVTALADVVVIDLSSLWAGPLCTQLLAAAGATVIKVESVQRPDGARHGTAAFFDLLHAGKHSVLVDLHDDGDRAALRALLQRADVVVEASRPRALAHLGLSVAQVAPAGGPRVWCRLTGHGGAAAERVGFGDDAAVAGGLVAWEDGEPRFVADAAADAATGLTAAVAIVDRLVTGGRWTVDVALARTAAAFAVRPATADGLVAAAPRARTLTGVARPLGIDSDEVLRRYAR